MSSKMGLEAMAGLFSTWLGSAVADSKRQEAEMWFRLSLPLDDHFKSSARKYLTEYNAVNSTTFSVSFPNPYRMTVREGKVGRRSRKRSGVRKARDPGNGRDPAR